MRLFEGNCTLVLGTVIVQRLTDLMWVGHSSTEGHAWINRFAGVWYALLRCLSKITQYTSLQGYRRYQKKFSYTWPHTSSLLPLSELINRRLECWRTMQPAMTYQAKLPTTSTPPIPPNSCPDTEVHKLPSFLPPHLATHSVHPVLTSSFHPSLL